MLNADDPADRGARRRARGGADLRASTIPSVAWPRPAPRRRLDPLPRLRGAAGLRPACTSATWAHWRCPCCGAARPGPTSRATRVVLHGVRGIAITDRDARGARSARELGLPGLHNAYNATAAAAAALAMGVPPRADRPRPGSAARPPSGAAERVAWTGRELVLLLAKNPTGANETVRTVLLDPEPPHLLIALNDRTADGHDVSWIWDVDYEPLLARAGLAHPDRRPGLRPGPALALRRPGAPSACACSPTPRPRSTHAVAATPVGRHALRRSPPTRRCSTCASRLVRRGVAEAFWRERMTRRRRFALEHAHYDEDLPFWRRRRGAPGLAGARPRRAPPGASPFPWPATAPRCGRSTARRGDARRAASGAWATSRPTSPARVHPVAGDLRAFDLGRRFALVVVAMNTLQVLTDPDDRLACLRARARAPAAGRRADLRRGSART